MGYSPSGRTEWDMTKSLSMQHARDALEKSPSVSQEGSILAIPIRGAVVLACPFAHLPLPGLVPVSASLTRIVFRVRDGFLKPSVVANLPYRRVDFKFRAKPNEQG